MEQSDRDKGLAIETDELVSVLLGALSELDYLPVSKLSQRLYSKLDSLLVDLIKGELK